MPIMKAGGRPQKSAFDVRMKAEGCPEILMDISMEDDGRQQR